MTEPQDIKFKAKADGSTQHYVEILPDDYDPEKQHNLLIAFHGHGSDRWQYIKDERDECRAARKVAAEHGMILLALDYRAKTSWMGPLAESDTAQVIEEQCRVRKVGKVILVGGSMGGTSVLIFTALHPELVHGVCSQNSTANMVEFSGFPREIATAYGGTKRQQPQEYKKRSPEFTPERFKGMPMAFTTGGRDQTVPCASVHRLAQALQKQQPQDALLIHRDKTGHSTNYKDTKTALEFVVKRAFKTRDEKRYS